MNQLKDIQALLFNETELKQGELVQNWLNGFGNLKMKIWYQAKEVSGGLVTVGDGPDASYLSRKYVFIPHTLTDVCSHGILV